MVGHNHVQSLPTLVEHIPLEVLDVQPPPCLSSNQAEDSQGADVTGARQMTIRLLPGVQGPHHCGSPFQ